MQSRRIKGFSRERFVAECEAPPGGFALPPESYRLRFLIALAASLCLHAGAAGVVEAVRRLSDAGVPEAPAPLSVRLQPPAEMLNDTPAEPLLKDTLAEEATESAERPKPPEASRPAPSAPRSGAQAAARRKLVEHLFYPPEAIEQRIEGEVRLLIVFDAGGRVVSAQVAASSGHLPLDRAAVEAARAMGRLPGVGAGEMILPVVFRLE